MLGKFKNKLKKGVSGVIDNVKTKVTNNKIETPNSLIKMKPFIDMALDDGILTEKERKMLFTKADKEGIDEIEFEFYLESCLEKVKTENWKRMDSLILQALDDGILTEKEREILMKKAKLYHLDIDEFELHLEEHLGKSDKYIAEKRQDEEIGGIMSDAKMKNEEVLNARKERQLSFKNQIKGARIELEKY